MTHLLPGMGADERMFPGPWRELPDVAFVRWPKNFSGKTIQTLARLVIRQSGIKEGDILIGSSLGGMVACEITKQLEIQKLFLVGSAKNSREIGSLLRILSPLADLAPMEMIRHCAGKLPSELARMFYDSDPQFIRAMCRAVLSWEGLDESRIRAIRIHGRHDRVIPLPSEVDCVVDGGHLIAMSHAKECAAYIRARV